MEIDSYLAGGVVITLTTLLAVLGLVLVRRKVSVETLTSFHEVGGFLLSVVGTMYAVLMGLIVVDAMSKFESAKQNVQQEANALADVFMLSGQFAPAKKQEIRDLCVDYAHLVVDKEWQAMDHNSFSPQARSIAIKLITAVSSIDPQTNRDQSLYQVIVGEACQIWDSRHARTHTACGGLPTPEWIVLVVGGVATIVFTYFFGLENLKAQTVMTAMVTLLIALNLYLILLFAYPYSGDVKVSTGALDADIEIFKEILNSPQAKSEAK